MVAGHFNPAHSGHIDHIKKAKKLGDWLIVSINDDNDCLRKSGYCFPLEERKAVVSAFRWVDEVVTTISSGGNQVETLRVVRPDIFAKGGDRTIDRMNGEEIAVCEELGIKIVYGVGDLLNSSRRLIEETIWKHSTTPV